MIVGVGHANVTGVPFRSRSSRANFEKVEKEIFFREREREREKRKGEKKNDVNSYISKYVGYLMEKVYRNMFK